MIKFFKLILIIIVLVSFSGCSEWDADKNRFVDAYKDVIAIRMVYNDTAIANPKVKKILSRYGYTKESFKSDFFRYSADHDLFRAMMDSAQIRAKREIEKFNKKQQRYAE
jgi:hypothetical protein